MTTNIHTETRMRSIPQQNVAEMVGGPDPAWRGLYKIGGILAIVYMVGSLIVPAVMLFMKSYDFNMDAATLLTFIAENRLWWIVWQGLILESSILLIVTYVALFVALKHLNNAYAAIGAIVGEHRAQMQRCGGLDLACAGEAVTPEQQFQLGQRVALGQIGQTRQFR
ncbi:MAG: hypothetical protein R2867_39225 [Caldilineaceae bacterium]